MISIPLHAGMTDKEQDFVIQSVKEAVANDECPQGIVER